MFGKGKETATLEASKFVRQELNKATEGETQFELPDQLRLLFDQSLDVIEEYVELKDTAKRYRLPRGQKEAYANRIWVLETQIEGASRVMKALKKGYEYHPAPKTYYAGYISPPKDRLDRQLRLDFGAPIPTPVLHRYQDARSTKLFNDFVVLSPDRNAFRQVASLRVDPVLIGIIQTDVGYAIQSPTTQIDWQTTRTDPGLILHSGVPMRIAHWDLGKDLTHMPQAQTTETK